MRVAALCGLAGLVGCQAVEVEYKAAPDPAKPGSVAEVQQLASDGYEFVAPTKTVLIIAPADMLDAEQKKPDASTTPASTTTGAQAKAGSGQAAVAPKSKAKVSGSRKVAASSAQAASQPASSAGPSSTSSNVPNPTDAADSASLPLARGQIQGKTWMVVAAPVPDYDNAFYVRGVSGFWKATTLAIARYSNSDRVSSVSSTAENYVPKRIEEGTSIATAVIGAFGGAASTENDDLRPFKLDLPSQSILASKPGDVQSGWSYTLEYQEPVSLPGTVSLGEASLPSGKVSYWPVPACQVVKLTLIHQDDSVEFYVTVAAPGRYRLQPLPIAGKLTLGSTCGGSVSGTTTVDPLSAISDDVTAVQQAVQKLKKPVKPPVSAPSSPTKPKTP